MSFAFKIIRNREPSLSDFVVVAKGIEEATRIGTRASKRLLREIGMEERRKAKKEGIFGTSSDRESRAYLSAATDDWEPDEVVSVGAVCR